MELQLPPEAVPFLVGLAATLGLLECFVGYRLFKILLAVTGFLVGGMLAGGLAFTLAAGNTWFALGAGIAGAMVGAVALFTLYYVGVFLFGACLGALFVASLLSVVGVPAVPLALAAGALIGGVASLLLQKLVIILATAFSGAASVVLAALYFVRPELLAPLFDGSLRLTAEHLVYLGVWTVLAVTGLAVQFGITARPPPEKKQRAPEEVGFKEKEAPPHEPHPDPVPNYVPAYNEPSYTDAEVDTEIEPTDDEIDAAIAEADRDERD